jgi:hypothetical protein
MLIVHCVPRNAEYVKAQWYPLRFQFGTSADHNKGIVLQLINSGIIKHFVTYASIV